MIKSVAVQSLLLAISGLMAFSELPASASATVLDSPQQGATVQASPEQVLIAQDRDDDDDDDDRDDRSEMESGDDDDDSESVELDRSIQTAIVDRVAAQSNVAVSQLRLVAARRETWTDGCLGLGTAEQLCTQVITPGYLVVLLNGDQPLVYRTNEAGTVVALDREATNAVVIRRQTTTTTTQQPTPQPTPVVVSGQQTTVTTQMTQTRFSQTVRTAVFQAIAQSRAIEVSQLRLVEVRQRAWANGCLGLSLSDRTCTQAITPGYLVVASRGDQVFVYRTDATGSVVLFDERATEIRNAQLRARTTAISFRDVSSNYWAASFIRELAALDIIDGYPDGSYRPDQPVTRAEFAAIIRRAFNQAEVRQAINFLDVDRRYWAYSAIQETYRMGFLSNVANNLFRPVNSISKGDVLFALATGLRLSTNSSTDTLLSVYNQTNLSTEQRVLLAALTEQGIVVNYPDVRSINLDRTVTRAEVAVIVYQTLASLGCVQTIDSPYVIDGGDVVSIDNDRDNDRDDDDDDDQEGRSVNRDEDGDRPRRQNCNQGIGNGAEGCDPGNSSPRGGSNDEGGRTPGDRP